MNFCERASIPSYSFKAHNKLNFDVKDQSIFLTTFISSIMSPYVRILITNVIIHIH